MMTGARRGRLDGLTDVTQPIHLASRIPAGIWRTEMLAKRPLGRTGMDVSVLGYGASELRGGLKWAPEIADDEAGKILNAVLDAGINFIDTSIDYGRSEELIGTY